MRAIISPYKATPLASAALPNTERVHHAISFIGHALMCSSAQGLLYRYSETMLQGPALRTNR